MPYSNTWTLSFEGSPSDLDQVSEGALRIRDLKTAIRERMEKNHYWDPSGTDADHGEHLFCTLRSQSSKPTPAASKGHIYTKSYDGHIELFYEREDGVEVQITPVGSSGGGGGTPSGEFPSGTKMVFYQNTAPTGWTIDTSLNDRLLYITKGSAAGGHAGGIPHSSGTWQQPSHVLTVAEIPAHTHTVYASYFGGASVSYSQGDTPNGMGTLTTSSTGGGGAHDHGNTWRPAAYCAIICTKS